MTKKSLHIERLSAQKHIDFGRAKYFLEKANWNFLNAANALQNEYDEQEKRDSVSKKKAAEALQKDIDHKKRDLKAAEAKLEGIGDKNEDLKAAEALQKDIDHKKRDLKAAEAKLEGIDDENEDLFNIDKYRINRKTSPESEKFRLKHGEQIIVEEEDGEISTLIEGVKSDDKEQKELKLVSEDHINVGKAKFFLDKCNWRFQEARKLAADSTYDKYLIYKNVHKYPHQHIDLVDGNITFRFFEANPPPPDNILTYFLKLIQKFSLSNKQTQFVLSSVNGRYEIAEDLVLTYEAFENFGVYHEESWKKLKTIMHYCEEHDRLQDIKRKIVSNEPTNANDKTIKTENDKIEEGIWEKKMSEVVKLYREKFHKDHTLCPSLRNNNDDLIDQDEFELLMFCRQQCKILAPYDVNQKILSKFDEKIMNAASAQEGEVVKPFSNEILIQRNEEPKEALLFAFKIWTNTGDRSAKRILEKVKWNINDGFKLDSYIKDHHNHKGQNKSYEFFRFKKYFHKEKDLEEFIRTMCLLPCSVQKSVAMKIAADHFKERENYKDFEEKLLDKMESIDNTRYIEKEKAKEVAKEFYETDQDYTKFGKEMDKVSTYLSEHYVEVLKEKYFRHRKEDGVKFKNEVMKVPYIERSAVRDFARIYFSYEKNYINFLKEMENHLMYISKEYLETLGNVYFENDENYETFLEKLLDLPFIDKLVVKKFAKEHLSPDKELPSDPEIINESDEKKEENKEKATENYNKFLENVFVIPFVEKKAVVELTKEYYGSHENYAEFQNEMDDNPSYIHQKYFYSLGEKYFSDNQILLDFKKPFFSEERVSKENVIKRAKEYYGSHENYPKFEREIMADYSLFFGKQYLEFLAKECFAEEYFDSTTYQKYLTFLKNLFEVLYTEKKLAVQLVQKYCCPNKKYVEFQDKMATINSINLQRQIVEPLVKDYFGEHKNYWSFQKRLFDVLFIGTEEAEKAAEEYYSSDVNYKKFIEAIKKDNCKPDDHIPREYIEFLVKKYPSQEEDYKKYVNKLLENRYVKIKTIKELCTTYKNYQHFIKEIDDYSNYILKNYIEFLVKKYFSEEKNYQEFMLNLLNVEYIKHDIARKLELEYFKDHPNFKWYEAEKEKYSNYISKVSLVALEKTFFSENKNYKKLQEKLFDVPFIEKERLIKLSREYFCSDQRYRYFRDEIDVHSYYIDKQYLEYLGEKHLSEDYKNIQKKWVEDQYIEKEIALAVARKYYLPTEQYVFFQRRLTSIPFAYMPKNDTEKLGKEYFGPLKLDYKEFHQKLLEVPYIRIDHVVKVAEEYYSSNGREVPNKYKMFKDELVDNPIFLRHQYLAALGKKYFSDYKNYQEYVNNLSDFPYVEEKTVLKVAEKSYSSHENYQKFLKELTIDQSTHVSSKYVEFLAKNNFGEDKKYMDFKKEFAYNQYIEKETAQKFVEKQYGGDKYYDQKCKQFLEEINTNSFEYISKEYVWSLGEKHFKKEQNYMEFQKKLINLSSNKIEEETQKFIKGEDVPSRYYINHLEKMINPAIYISKSYLEALVNRYFGKNEYRERFMVKLLDNLYVEEKTVKEVAKKKMDNKNYPHFLEDMKDHSTYILKPYLLLLGYREFTKSQRVTGFVQILKDFKKNINIQSFKVALEEMFPEDRNYTKFVHKINLVPSDLAAENRVKLTHSDKVQCLGIWTGLDYGKIVQVYQNVCRNDFWDTLGLLVHLKRKGQLPDMNNFFKLDEKYMRQKRLEYIISNIPRQKGYFDERVTLIDPKTDRDYHCQEGRLDIFPHPETEDVFGNKIEPLKLDVTVYKDGILIDIHLNNYREVTPSVEGILLGERPFNMGDLEREFNFYMVDRVDEYCPTDKFVFRN